MDTSSFVTREELISLYELQLLSTANHFTLWGEANQRKITNKGLVKLFFSLVKIIQPDLFIEAGAKTADASIRAKRINREARVVAFEASPINFKLYSKKMNHAKRGVEYLHYALSDVEGTIDFNIRLSSKLGKVPSNSGANSILPRANPHGSEFQKVSVQSRRLDDFFPDAKNCAMWVDVEGATKQVFGGGARTLKATQIAIVEVEDQEVWEGQWKAGQVISAMLDAGLVPVARDFEFKGQYNIVFLNRRLFTSDRNIRQSLEFFYSHTVKNLEALRSTEEARKKSGKRLRFGT